MNDSKPVIFISGRFRSGTSMLWNVFHQLPGYESWYEPLHPNLLVNIHHVKPKKDHLGIEDYWSNYRDLGELEQHFCSSFGHHRMFMEKNDVWPELKKYIGYLIEQSGDKIPVLQFNRMDLRLGWLRNQFPHATIIHIHREPQSLWQSCRKHLPEEFKEDESHPDAYDLMQWSCDLAEKFPMLQARPGRSSYYRHYFIWKLSRKMAQSGANMQLSLIDDFHKSDKGLQMLAKALNWDSEMLKTASECVQQVSADSLSEDQQQSFRSIESEVNQSFKKLGLDSLMPSCLLQSLKITHSEGWREHSASPSTLVNELLTAMHYQKEELTKALNAEGQSSSD